MNIFRRPDYKSDATLFIDQLKTAKPDLDAKQMEGRGLLWDKSVDRGALQSFKSSKVAQQPYVYQTAPK
jgi:hypothetical protein